MYRRPRLKMIKAIQAVAVKMASTGKIDRVLKRPTPAEVSAAAPICMNPSNADALPIFLSNGANASAAAFGYVSPRHDNKMKSMIKVVASPNQ